MSESSPQETLKIEVAKLEPKAGDIIVLRLATPPPPEQLQELALLLQSAAPGAAAVVLSGDDDLSKVPGHTLLPTQDTLYVPVSRQLVEERAKKWSDPVECSFGEPQPDGTIDLIFRTLEEAAADAG